MSEQTHDKPLAIYPLISYRYRGQYGWIMIAAKDDADALREAKRSIDDQRVQPVIGNLQIWNEEQRFYRSVCDEMQQFGTPGEDHD